jgi:type IV pilus assembly protein PilB
MRLSGSGRSDSAELRDALAERFPDARPNADENHTAEEGDTLLPHDGERLAALRKAVAEIEASEASATETIAPLAAALPPLPDRPPVPSDAPPAPPGPVRFGPSTSAPPPIPFDLSPPGVDDTRATREELPPSVNTFELPDVEVQLHAKSEGAALPPAFDEPMPARAAAAATALPDVDVQIHKADGEAEAKSESRSAPIQVPPGSVTVKKSSAKGAKSAPQPGKAKADKNGGRRLFGKKAKEKAPEAEPEDVAPPVPRRDGAETLAIIQAAMAAPLAEPESEPEAAPEPDSYEKRRRAVVLTPEQQEGGPRHTGKPLGELLTERGILSEDQLSQALMSQTGSGKRLGNILVDLGLLSERALIDVLAEQLQLEIVELGRMRLVREIVTLLPEADARALRAVPIGLDGDRIEVAVADPLVEFLQEDLITALGAPVKLRFATGTEIEAVINKMYAAEADLGDALRLFEARMESRKTTKETDATVTTVVDENAPVVKIVNYILDQAVRARASDVHIEPMADVVRVRVRTDGALHEVMSLPGSMSQSLVSRIKVMSDMNIVERRKPQDGQLACTVAGRELDVRVSTTPTVFGEKCVLRVLDKTKAVINLPGLGMNPQTADRYSDLIRSPYGMVICAGPTGSGKTTTLYATLTAINSEEINVVTIEDPVEYVFPKINQIQINEASGLTFANGLRAILRQDPDAILVGEIRDVETARIAVQAALTGHFVMSSLHATDATSALHRFMDMGIEPFLVASSLLGVVGQRLVRKVCPNCTTSYEPTPEERTFFERAGGDADKTEFVQGSGCSLCEQTGFYDRVGIYEVLRVSDEFKELIVTNATHAELREMAMQQGMKTLRDQAIQLVVQDKTTIAEVLRTVYVL